MSAEFGGRVALVTGAGDVDGLGFAHARFLAPKIRVQPPEAVGLYRHERMGIGGAQQSHQFRVAELLHQPATHNVHPLFVPDFGVERLGLLRVVEGLYTSIRCAIHYDLGLVKAPERVHVLELRAASGGLR